VAPQGIAGEVAGSKPLICMRFHGVFLGNQHEIWSKRHNGKVTSKDRKTRYFSGVINAGIFGDIQITILKNTFKDEGSQQPDYNILLVEPMGEQKVEPVSDIKPVSEGEIPADPDDDLPF